MAFRGEVRNKAERVQDLTVQAARTAITGPYRGAAAGRAPGGSLTGTQPEGSFSIEDEDGFISTGSVLIWDFDSWDDPSAIWDD
jgi:hypothetical protein